MTTGELHKAGVGGSPPSGGEMILNPIEAAHNNLVSRGLVAAATGQGPWEAWPGSMRVSPVPGPARLGLVHVEEGDRGYPVLVPLLGDTYGHVVIGDPSLNIPIKPQIQKVEVLKVAAEERRAKEEAAALNRERQQGSLAQRIQAIGITSALIARAAGSLPEGDLHVTVYDPEGGRQFAPLAIMNRNNRVGDGSAPYEYSRSLSGLLEWLSNDVQQRYELLGRVGFRSLRAQAEKLGELAVPWRIVALMSGLDEQLRPNDQVAINLLVRQAADAGVSIIMSGFGTASPATRVGLEPDGRAVSSTLPGRKIHLDDAPTFDDLQRSVTHGRPINAGVRVSGQRYNRAIAARWQQYENTKIIMAAHFRDFPLLMPDFLTNQLALGDREYQRFNAMIAPNADQEGAALELARWALLRNTEMPAVAHLAAWATLQLAQSATEKPRSHWRDSTLHTAAGKRVQTQIANLAHLVFATAPGGLEQMQVHPDIVPYIAQYLPDEPPAWIYRLVADTATVSRLSLTPGREVALEAICYDLEQTFNPDQEQPLNLHRRENRALRDALIELRLLDLHGFTEETNEELRDMLARRAARRLASVSRDQLPKAAYDLFDAFQDYMAVQETPTIGSTPHDEVANP